MTGASEPETPSGVHGASEPETPSGVHGASEPEAASGNTGGAGANPGRNDTDPRAPGARDAASEALVRSMGDVLAAALGVGASVAKVVAQATAGSKGVDAVPGDRPLEAIVHYSVATVTNVLGLVVAGAGLGVRGASAAAAAAADAAGAAGTPRGAGTTTNTSGATGAQGAGVLPTVRVGHALRVPLSVENPGSERMSVKPACLTMTAAVPGTGERLDVRSVRFQPAGLDIAPRDFEKLTVFVETTPATAPGRYEAIIELGLGSETRLRFEVVGAD